MAYYGIEYITLCTLSVAKESLLFRYFYHELHGGSVVLLHSIEQIYLQTDYLLLVEISKLCDGL